MPTTNELIERTSEIAEWRRHIHAHPELMYAVEGTAAFVAGKLREFGCDQVIEGIGRTGVVGVVEGRGKAGPTIGLRADMDALPITEKTGRAYASKTGGRMHACGHDGHTAMLLGAARDLAGSRDFDGRVALIFQPAEEGGAGGRAMVQDGLMERFAIEQVFGMHNLPGLPIGHFGVRNGPIMAATDEMTIEINGQGGHAALPHRCIDPMVIAAQMITALQTVSSRFADPLDSVVVSITTLKSDSNAHNVIPQNVTLGGTVRTLDPVTRDAVEKQVSQIVDNTAKAFGATSRLRYRRGYPPTVNNGEAAAMAALAMRQVVPDAQIQADHSPMMGGEDFSYMLEARPGAFVFIGNGDSAVLHSASYDFDDDAIGYGVRYWRKLVETALPLR